MYPDDVIAGALQSTDDDMKVIESINGNRI